MPSLGRSPAVAPGRPERRASARTPDALSARIRTADRTCAAVVRDLGEGGARCFVPVPDGLAAGAQVLLVVAINDVELRLDATVLAVEPLARGRAGVRLRFSPLGAERDVVRRRVLAQQHRASAQQHGAPAAQHGSDGPAARRG